MVKKMDGLARILVEHVPTEIAPHTDPTTRWASVAIVVHSTPKALNLLFIERAHSERDPWSGHMAFPGGRHDVADPALISTAVRETREEVSLDLHSHARVIGQLDDVQAVGRGKRLPLLIRPYIFAVDTHPPLIPDPREVKKALWIPLSFLDDDTNIQDYNFTHSGREVAFPSYKFGPHTIWGLTFMMVQSLRHVLRGA